VRENVLRDLRALREQHDAEIRKLIATAARIGIRSEDIASALGISRATLWRHYSHYLSARHDPPTGTPTSSA
jgi:DNA invertase Pin-like site-specific DNA recombinase